ncbi:hypothetical protein AHAT_33770 [Agarivorans sp. Toyoura001]|nr:hypothetical protein AHAT_33770 [Agarivorans sp. Toyoura001]
MFVPRVPNPTANVLVEIEPWNERTFSSRKINRDFYIKTPSGNKKYSHDGVKVVVTENSNIRCLVYPLHDRIDQLRDQLANQLVKNENSVLNKDGGIEGL